MINNNNNDNYLNQWELNFIGRIEYLSQHFEILATQDNQCSKYFNHLPENFDIHEKILSIHAGNRQVSQADIIEKLRNAITKDYFYKLVDYYYQDFICFGYSFDYDDWKNKNYLWKPL